MFNHCLSYVQGRMVMTKEKKRILVHKNFLLSNSQIDSLEKLRDSIGTKNIVSILRGIISNFFTLSKEKQTNIIKELCIVDGKKRILVPRHFQLYKLQVDNLIKLNNSIGTKNVASIIRATIDHFFSKTEEEQIKIIKDNWWGK